ncbi:hypothetical protein PR003_g15026 [Phytophthora rubi]|uniref:Uncharacterized protein n=1 Tax=Phytophthora rubi TaxID=129364 RepID=A0A6A3L1L7_9STRA|nr:hypothetical protein PR002_g14471 [Phytophthora rubi]KAE9331386.1 hypothetical protein PR003_g15026 [Phytophthora rubi]
MNAYFDDVPTSASLLLQCGYRSKVCTNHRATKLDGTLHKLCEFHRRKANLNQQRLHKRQREKRAAQQLCEPVKMEFAPAQDRPFKKARLVVEPIVDPIMHTGDYSYYYELGATQHVSPVEVSEFALQRMGSQDMDILELLLLDMQSLPPLESFLPSADDKGSIVV